jgi:hypothetical protein
MYQEKSGNPAHKSPPKSVDSFYVKTIGSQTRTQKKGKNDFLKKYLSKPPTQTFFFTCLGLQFNDFVPNSAENLESKSCRDFAGSNLVPT